MTTNSDILKKAMLEALEKSLGVITSACKQVGIARSTHYEWYSKDKEYMKVYRKYEQTLILATCLAKKLKVYKNILTPFALLKMV